MAFATNPAAELPPRISDAARTAPLKIAITFGKSDLPTDELLGAVFARTQSRGFM